MIDTIVCGIDHHRKWMLHVIYCSSATGSKRDFMWFFNTREEAETRFEQLVGGTSIKNMLVKIVKVRAFEHLELDYERVEQEN